MPDNRNLKAFVLLIILSLIWGTSFILIKQGLKVFAPTEVATLRVSAAFLFLLPVAITRVKGLTSHDLQVLLVSGLLGIFIPAFLFSTAQTKIYSSVAGVLNTLSPICTMIIGAIFFGQRFRGWAIVGALTGLGGTVMLMLSRDGSSVTGINYYSLLIVAACLMYGSNLNWVKFRIHGLPALTITSVSILLIGPLAMIYLFAFTGFTVKLGTVDGAWTSFGFVVLLGCMSTAVATYLFNELVKITTPLFASSVTYLMPIVSVGWGLLDDEKLYAGHYIGMALILGGVYLANRKRD
ncbi:MAG TPA: DMT family transporter [Cyclobacteriaceae bacterium]